MDVRCRSDSYSQRMNLLCTAQKIVVLSDLTVGCRLCLHSLPCERDPLCARLLWRNWELSVLTALPLWLSFKKVWWFSTSKYPHSL